MGTLVLAVSRHIGLHELIRRDHRVACRLARSVRRANADKH